MYAVSPSCTAITGYVASPNAYDVVGGPLAPTTVTSGPTTSLSFINSETYTTVATGTYSFKAQRSFNLCQGTFVTISMTITADDWVGAVAVDATILGAGTFPEPAGWGVGFTPKSVTQTLYLPSGVHYIYVTSNNMPENGWQGNSLDVVGTVTSATPLAIDREDIASCSPGTTFCTIPPIEGSTEFCKGQEITETDAEPGGTWTIVSGGTLVNSIGSGTNAIGQAYVTYYGVSAGNVVIEYTDACDRPTPPKTITVEAPPPTPTVTGAGPICAGTSATLTATSIPYTGGGTLSYVWSPTGLNPDIVTPPATTVYSVYAIATYAYTTCPSPVKTVTVTVRPDPSFSVGYSTTCVAGVEVLTLTTTDASCGTCTFLWTGPGVTTAAESTEPEPALSPAMDGIYTLTVTNTFGCHAAHSETVTITPPPVFTPTFGPTATICAGSPLHLYWNTPSGPVSGYTYSWAGPGISSTAANPLVTGSATTANSGVYSITVTHGTDCPVTKTVSVTVHPDPSIGATASPSVICTVGGSATLTATGIVFPGETYTWSPTATLSSGSTASTIATPAAATIYTVKTTGAFGCVGTATVSVVVDPVGTFTPTYYPHPIICTGEPWQLFWNTPSTPGTGYTYTWTGPVTISTPHAANPSMGIATAGEGGLYTVIVENSHGCTARGSVKVPITTTPTITATATPSVMCAGSASNLTTTVTPTSSGIVYSWSPAVLCPGCSVTPVTPAVTTTYSVIATLGGCPSLPALVTVTVDVPLAPVITGTTSVCSGSVVTYTASPSGGTWSLAPGSLGITLFTPLGTTATVTTSNPGPGAVPAVLLYNVTNACGSYTANLPVNIFPTPAPYVINTPFIPKQICLGSGFNIDINPDGGTTSLWTCSSVPPDISFTPATSPATHITGINAGTTAYTYTTINSYGCSGSISFTVTVNPVPTCTPTYTSPLCTGTPWNLFWNSPSSVPVPGYTYSWSGPGGFTSADANPAMLPATIAMDGIYTLTVTNTSTGCNTVNTVSVTVTPTPTPFIINTPKVPSQLCVGDDFEIDVNPDGGTTSLWTASPPDVTFTFPTSTSTDIMGVTVGTTTVTYTTYAGGCLGALTFTLTVNPVPTCTPTYSPSGPLCAGTPWNLYWNSPVSTPVTGYVYSWVGPDGFTSSDPNPAMGAATTAQSGVYTLTVANSFGCHTVVPVTVTVSPTPAPSIYFNPTIPAVICLGASYPVYGSPGISGGFTATWSSSSAVITITPVSPTSASITASAPGTAVITYAVTGAAGCIGYATYTITVSALPPAPSPVSGPTTLCEGSSITLSDVSSGGVWSSSPSSIATIDATGDLTGISGGDALVSYTVSNAYCQLSATYTVDVVGEPTVCVTYDVAIARYIITAAPGTVSVTYELGDYDASTASWIGGTYISTPVAVTGAYTIPIGAPAAAILSFSYGGCTWYTPACIAYRNGALRVVHISGITNTCPGTPATLTANVTGPTYSPSYQWFKSSSSPFAAISGATDSVYTYTPADSDQVYASVSDTSGTTISDTVIFSTDSCGGVHRHSSPSDNIHSVSDIINSIRLVPNPNKGVFTVVGIVSSDVASENVEVEIADMIGQVVYKDDAAISNGMINKNVAMSDKIPNGIYMLRIKTANGNEVIRFTLNR